MKRRPEDDATRRVNLIQLDDLRVRKLAFNVPNTCFSKPLLFLRGVVLSVFLNVTVFSGSSNRSRYLRSFRLELFQLVPEVVSRLAGSTVLCSFRHHVSV